MNNKKLQEMEAELGMSPKNNDDKTTDINIYSEFSPAIINDTRTYTDLAQKEISIASNKTVVIEKKNTHVLHEIYENIRSQNEIMRKTVKQMHDMFSTDQSKTNYLKGTSDLWDTIGNILFVLYYFLYIVFTYIVVYRNIGVYWKAFYILFFLLFPGILGFLVTYVGRYVMNIP